MSSKVSAALAAGFCALLVTPTASAVCDISRTKCAVNGGKCNIHFRNRTGDTGGSDGSSNIQQTSAAQTVKVKARTEASEQTGNKLTIPAGTNKTMNLDRKAKKGFHEIRIHSQNHKDTRSIVMGCEDIKAILNGNGRCKIFHGVRYNIHPAVNFYLGYQCDGGNIGGPTDARID
ncbi:MAG: hypothetical protein AAFQ12_04065 [Pseudomonadota bacterium]